MSTDQISEAEVQQILEAVSSGSFLSDMAMLIISVGVKLTLAIIALMILRFLYWYVHKKSTFDIYEAIETIKSDPKALALYLGLSILGITLMLGFIISR